MNSVVPVLMRNEEVISLKEAMFRTGNSEKTIRRWCKKDGIGRQTTPGAPWQISAVALEAKRYGDETALVALRQGNFTSDDIRRYLIALGLEGSASR